MTWVCVGYAFAAVISFFIITKVYQLERSSAKIALPSITSHKSKKGEILVGANLYRYPESKDGKGVHERRQKLNF